MNKIKPVVVFLILFGFGSCKPLHLSDATQRHYVSGLFNVANHTSYSFNLKATRPFTILKMVLVSGNSKTPITSISFTNSQTMVGHKFELSPKKMFQPGTYTFGFTQEHTEKKQDQQKIQLTYLLNKRIEVRTFAVRQGDTQFGK